MARRWISLVCVGFWLLSAHVLLADGVILDGVSPRSLGRGGTNIAFADNGAVLFDNPAGMTNVDGGGLIDIGATALITDFRYSDPLNGAASDVGFYPLPQVSWIGNSADDQWAYGFGIFVPAGISETYDLECAAPWVGQRHYKSFTSLVKILPGVAYRMTDRLSIGATLGVGASHMEVEGPYWLQGPGVFRGTPTMLDLQGTGATLVWSAGLQYIATDATTIGLTYQSESALDLHGNARVDVPIIGSTEYDTQIDVTWPRSVGLGVKHALCPHRILSADVIWFDWSSAFDDFGIHLAQPTNPFYADTYEQVPLDWEDSVSIRLGYERLFNHGRTVRLGYVYHDSLIPNDALTPFIQATLEHAVSAGYGWQWRGWDLDAAYMFSFGQEQTVQTSRFLGGDFDQSTHEAQTHVMAMSFIRRF